MNGIRSRFSYANVMATIAVFLALGVGGGAVAAVKLKPNSVKTKTIKAKAVTTAKIADGAVTRPKLGDGAVTTPKLGDGAVTTPKLGGAAVTAAKLGAVNVRTAAVPATGFGIDSGASLTAPCAAGEKLVGGGAEVSGETNVIDNSVRVNESYPNGNGWTARATDSAGVHGLTVYALCVGA